MEGEALVAEVQAVLGSVGAAVAAMVVLDSAGMALEAEVQAARGSGGAAPEVAALVVPVSVVEALEEAARGWVEEAERAEEEVREEVAQAVAEMCKAPG